MKVHSSQGPNVAIGDHWVWQEAFVYSSLALYALSLVDGVIVDHVSPKQKARKKVKRKGAPIGEDLGARARRPREFGDRLAVESIVAVDREGPRGEMNSWEGVVDPGDGDLEIQKPRSDS